MHTEKCMSIIPNPTVQLEVSVTLGHHYTLHRKDDVHINVVFRKHFGSVYGYFVGRVMNCDFCRKLIVLFLNSSISTFCEMGKTRL
jgi:hypothetical protein